MDEETPQNTPGHVGPLQIAPIARDELIQNITCVKLLPNGSFSQQPADIASTFRRAKEDMKKKSFLQPSDQPSG